MAKTAFTTLKLTVLIDIRRLKFKCICNTYRGRIRGKSGGTNVMLHSLLWKSYHLSVPTLKCVYNSFLHSNLHSNIMDYSFKESLIFLIGLKLEVCRLFGCLGCLSWVHETIFLTIQIIYVKCKTASLVMFMLNKNSLAIK